MSGLWYVKLRRDCLADVTLQRWSPAQRWCWVCCLLLAADGNPRGSLTDLSGDPLTIADIHRMTHVSWHVADATVARALSAGRLSRDAEGVLHVVNFEHDQGVSTRVEVARSLEAADAQFAEKRSTNVALRATPDIASPARVNGPKQEQAQPQFEVENPSIVASSAGRSRSKLPISQYKLELIAEGLRGANKHTPKALASVLRGLSEHDLEEGLFQTRRAQPKSEAAYLVEVLKRRRADREAA